MSVTQKEIVEALQWFASNLRTNPTPKGTPKLDIIERIEREGIAPPDGYAIVPIEKQYLKHQPCGCVLCTCEDEFQCQGCGAKFCSDHNSKNLPMLTAAKESL